jgi:hypothetical protein
MEILTNNPYNLIIFVKQAQKIQSSCLEKSMHGSSNLEKSMHDFFKNMEKSSRHAWKNPCTEAQTWKNPCMIFSKTWIFLKKSMQKHGKKHTGVVHDSR